ncbi:MAG: DUF378 domain-containing protein [Desulfocurvibacter africanus]
MRTLDVITTILLIIGGLNWGLVGLFEFDLVAALFGTLSWFSRLVYVLVGLSAIYQAVSYKAMQRRWCSRVAVGAR